MKKLVIAFAMFIPLIVNAQIQMPACLISQGSRLSIKDTTVCSDEVLRIVAMPNGYKYADTTRFYWTDPTGKVISKDVEMSKLFKSTDTGTYICAIQEGSCFDTLKVSINVAEAREWAVKSTKSIICLGETIKLYSTQNIAKQLRWNYPPNSDFKCLNPPFCDSIEVRPTSSVIYTYVTEGCHSGASELIYVDTFPTFKSTTSHKFCIGQKVDSIALNNNFEPNATYVWKKQGNPNFISNLPNPKVLPNSSCVYDVTISNRACQKEESVKVVVANNYTIETTKDTMICPNQSVKLDFFISNLSPQEYVYKWIPGGYSTLGNSIVVRPTKTETYKLEVEYLKIPNKNNEYHCAFVKDIIVALKTEDSVKIKVEPQTNNYYLGQSIMLLAEPFQANIQYLWTINNTAQKNANNALDYTINKNLNSVKVQYTNKSGCIIEDTLTIRAAKYTPVLPSIFNANEESLRPLYTNNQNGKAILEYFQVFNRWGQVVYEVRKQILDDSFQGWNGNMKGTNDGAILAADVYMVSYQLRFEDDTLSAPISADVTLLR
jgi:hypothetical protein